MLLLYQGIVLDGTIECDNLHSTMLLLYPPGRLPPCPGRSNLHSTMLLLYHKANSSCPACVICIYIPLCFYFISARRRAAGLYRAFTFHYASTLSQPACRSLSNPSKFTFHYASTLSTSVSVHCVLDSIFTFHYASTLSKSMNGSEREKQNLHSTMLLLYLPYIRVPSFYFLIYIPLCFYFIEMVLDHNITNPYLHSTMLLLYRCSIPFCSSASAIYIPLCFYFICRLSVSKSTSISFTFHYASTLSKFQICNNASHI